MPQQRPPQQSALALEPQHEEVMAEAERLRLSRAYWRRRYPSLQAVLADQLAAHALLISARCAVRARLRKG